MKSRGYPIQRQVLIFALLTCASVLLPVGGGLFFHHYAQTQKRLANSMAATAQITASNVAAALAFSDKDTATELLKALEYDPLITAATILDLKQGVFAQFQRTQANAPAAKDLAQVEYAIVHGDVTFGKLIISGDIRSELHNTILTWGPVYAVAFLLAGLTVWFIARRFQRIIATPIIELAAVAERLTRSNDYSIRPQPTGCTEVVHLTATLNTLFTEIELRDARLDEKIQALEIEIRERLAAEETLRQNQHAMNRLAREAGMAEVAAGVIHNIGNTLTSISISSELIDARLTNAQHRQLRAIEHLLNPTSQQTAPIFDAHADGPELRTLLAQIATNLSTELTDTARLVGNLQTGNQHLKRIVATQQSLARTTHLSQFFVLNEALQEALLLARTITRQPTPIEDCPLDQTPVFADRSLVVQILVNLLLNAHEAIGSHKPLHPKISMAIGPANHGMLALSVTDNGEGIASERLLSIFTYGYTTKPTGNGFGLHNSANAARLMHGELLVSSPGVGCGSTFTLSLPTQPPTHSSNET